MAEKIRVRTGTAAETEPELVYRHYERLFARYPSLYELRGAVMEAYKRLKATYEADGKLLVCGNGGSAADAEHIVGELMKGFYKKRRLPGPESEKYGEHSEYLQGALRAIALTQHSALSTAFLNDVNPEMIFAQQVFGYGEAKDSFIGISTSGNSMNVVRAAGVAAAKGMKVIGLTGSGGGELARISDVCICVPEELTPDIQELHLPVYHTLCAMLEEYFFGEQ